MNDMKKQYPLVHASAPYPITACAAAREVSGTNASPWWHPQDSRSTMRERVPSKRIILVIECIRATFISWDGFFVKRRWSNGFFVKRRWSVVTSCVLLTSASTGTVFFDRRDAPL